MKNYIKSIITKLYKNNISSDTFIEKYEKETNYEVNEFYIKKLLQKTIQNKDANDVEEAVVLMYSGNFDHRLYLDELCKLLIETWHFKHEDLVELLSDLQDPSTINVLYKVAQMNFDYLNYDSTFQLARKSIKALYYIGNQDSIEKIKLLTNNTNSIISNYAKKELIQL